MKSLLWALLIKSQFNK